MNKIIMTDSISGEELFRSIFEKIGAHPESLSTPVMLRKGGSITVYLLGDGPHPYLSEEAARRHAKEGQGIYRADITRIG